MNRSKETYGQNKKMLYLNSGGAGASVGCSVGGGRGYWVGSSLRSVSVGYWHVGGVVVVG